MYCLPSTIVKFVTEKKKCVRNLTYFLDLKRNVDRRKKFEKNIYMTQIFKLFNHMPTTLHSQSFNNCKICYEKKKFVRNLTCFLDLRRNKDRGKNYVKKKNYMTQRFKLQQILILHRQKNKIK